MGKFTDKCRSCSHYVDFTWVEINNCMVKRKSRKHCNLPYTRCLYEQKTNYTNHQFNLNL